MVTIIKYKLETSSSGEGYIRLIIQSDDLNVVTFGTILYQWRSSKIII